MHNALALPGAPPRCSLDTNEEEAPVFGRPLELTPQAQVAEHPTGEGRLGAAAYAAEQDENDYGKAPEWEVLLRGAAFARSDENDKEYEEENASVEMHNARALPGAPPRCSLDTNEEEAPVFGRPLELMPQAQVAEHPTGEGRLGAAAYAAEQDENDYGKDPETDVLLRGAALRPVEEAVDPPLGFVNAVHTATLEWAKLYAKALQGQESVTLDLDEALADVLVVIGDVQESMMEGLRAKIEIGLGLQAGCLGVHKGKPKARSCEPACDEEAPPAAPALLRGAVQRAQGEA